MNTIKFSSAAGVNKGNIRENNEDNLYFNGFFLSEEKRDVPVFVNDSSDKSILVYSVFDGMGGEALGEEASSIATKTIKEYHEKIILEKKNNIEKYVESYISKTNERICKKIIDSKETRIGTTMASLFIENDTAKIYNIGDSRVYILRKNKLKQVSEDHTQAQRLINLGVISSEQAKTHKDKHKLTRHLGVFSSERSVEAYNAPNIPIEKGDKFLLCSDGLTDMVDDKRIYEILKQKKTEQEICEDLINEALNNGGSDNVTVIVVGAKTNSSFNRPKSNKSKYVLLLLFLVIMSFVIVTELLNDDREVDLPIVVEEEQIKVTSITWATRLSEVPVGKVDYVIASVMPQNSKSKINYKSSDSDVITIYEDGRYIAKSPGVAILTAEADGVYSEEMEVVVYD